MTWKDQLGILEVELYKKSASSLENSPELDRHAYRINGLSSAIMTRSGRILDENTISQYERYVKRFIRVGIEHGIRCYIVILRNAYDVLCAELVLKMKKLRQDVQLLCIELGSEYYAALPENLRARLWQIVDRADYVERSFFLDSETTAEEQALILADTLLYIYSWEDEKNCWDDFLPNIVKELICPNCAYGIKKIWLISMVDIRDII